MINGNFQQTRTTVGVTAIRIGGLIINAIAYEEITLKADTANAGVIYLGNTTSVTTTNGYPLEAGKEIKLRTANVNSIFAISGNAGQILHIIAT